MAEPTSNAPILTPAIRDSEDFHGYDYVLDSHEALRQRAAEDTATIARLLDDVERLEDEVAELEQRYSYFMDPGVQAQERGLADFRTQERAALLKHVEIGGVVHRALLALWEREAEDAATIAELREVLQAREVQYQKALDILARKSQEDIARLTRERDEAREELSAFMTGRVTKAFLLERAETAERALATLREARDAQMRTFVGWLSSDIPELHRVEVPVLADSLSRFLAITPPPPEEPR